MASRRSILATAAALITAATVALVPSNPASAASFTMTVDSPVVGGIGVDAIYSGGSGGPVYDIPPCAHQSSHKLNWNSSGNLVGVTSVPNSLPGLGSLVRVRYEFYPGPCGTYDPWTSDVGGIHFQADVPHFNLGTVKLPALGNPGSFRIDGDIISSLPITEGRVSIDTFQIPTSYPDPPAPIPTNGITSYGAFGHAENLGDRWTGGVGWGGRYIIFIRDTVTGRSYTVFADIWPGDVPTIDLDAVCFGFDICTQSPGAPAPVPGEFYPTSPTRILDTRLGLGIENGAVRTGDGRYSSLDPVKRRNETANHDLKVTGKFGIPEDGVSAVLLNVTAVGAPSPGYLSIIPKPARVGNIFSDQASYGALPGTSNINVSNGSAVPNMVLARVGAGGKIRIVNSLGPTHVIADVAGWFGTDGLHDDGAGFAGVVPARLMDSRSGIGGPQRRFVNGETRELQVAGVAGIPSNAESVVLNITSVVPNQAGSYITAWPKGEPAPNASNVNGATNAARANLAVVKVGSGGKINLRTSGGTDVIVDIMGSFGPYGGAVTPVDPRRAVDSRSGIGTERRALNGGESRKFTLRGSAGVPSDATAVIVNITAVNATDGGYFTAYPSDAAQPIVSNLNFGINQTVPNLAMLKLGSDGAIRVFNARGKTNVIIDVMGYVS
ncbi:MAG: hypothetical protein ACR2O6_13090 [Ilumatobacteraceae bacterium]